MKNIHKDESNIMVPILVFMYMAGLLIVGGLIYGAVLLLDKWF